MIRRFQAREARFSAKTLRMWAASGLPEALGVRAAVGDAPVEILLYDEIGWYGVTAKDFVLALAQAGDGPIHLRINSPGGDAFEGMAIYNALRARTAPVTVTVDGIAASAASVVAMAGKTVNMPEQAMLMIHNCWGLCCGNRNDMLEMASIQQKIDGLMAEIYATKSGQTKDQMTAIMDAETWYTSAEAKGAGLCDAITPSAQQSALSGAKIMARAGILARVINAALPAYDPDGDGDNDAEEALGHLNSIATLVNAAIDCLTGTEADDGDTSETEDGIPIVPGAQARRRRPRAAATEAEWVCGADQNLPLDTSDAWDGSAAAERILDDAGFNGNSPDPAKAKRGFLAWDHHNPNLKGSYKLPFADLVGGELKAVKGGIDAAASRLPQTDIPADVKTKARDVLDAYEARMNKGAAAQAARQRRLRLAEAEAA